MTDRRVCFRKIEIGLIKCLYVIRTCFPHAWRGDKEKRRVSAKRIIPAIAALAGRGVFVEDEARGNPRRSSYLSKKDEMLCERCGSACYLLSWFF